jgi:hypothetical protein
VGRKIVSSSPLLGKTMQVLSKKSTKKFLYNLHRLRGDFFSLEGIIGIAFLLLSHMRNGAGVAGKVNKGLLCLFCAWVIVNWNAPVVEILRYFPNNV